MTTSNFASPLPGQLFRLNRLGSTSSGTPVFVGLVTISSKHNSETEDIYVPDQANPASISQRISVVKAQTWDMTVSGTSDPLMVAPLVADWRAGVPAYYQLIEDTTGAKGGETETGLFLITDYSKDKSDNSSVKFSATLKGQGASIVAAAS